MRGSAVLVVSLVALAVPSVAMAGDVCGDAYTQVQLHRRAGKLRAAKQALVSCSQEICSSAVRVDCLKWSEEVERALSTVVFDVRSPDGAEVTDVRVYAGEELVAPLLDGRQIPMDPGEVVLRFVRDTQTVEKRAVIREGEKFRTIHVELPGPRVAAAPTAAVVGAPSASLPPRPEAMPPEASTSTSHSVPPLSWALGGVGVAGLVTFGVFAGMGYAKESSMRDGCFTTDSCASSDVSTVRTQYLVGDIALGVGVVSLAAAVGYWLLHRPSPSPSLPSTTASRGVGR